MIRKLFTLALVVAAAATGISTAAQSTVEAPAVTRSRCRHSSRTRAGRRCRTTGCSARRRRWPSIGTTTSGSCTAREPSADDKKALAAPAVLEFDADGKFLNAWGGPGPGFDWPDSEHGIYVDYKDNVWIGRSSRSVHVADAAMRRHAPEVRRTTGSSCCRLAATTRTRAVAAIQDTVNVGGRHRDRRVARDQRSLRHRRLRQPPRDRVRCRHGQVQATCHMVEHWPTLDEGMKWGAAINFIPDNKGGTWMLFRSEPPIHARRVGEDHGIVWQRHVRVGTRVVPGPRRQLLGRR